MAKDATESAKAMFMSKKSVVKKLDDNLKEALRAASERVRARYGFACTRTDEEESQLRQWVSRYSSDDTVRVIGQPS